MKKISDVDMAERGKLKNFRTFFPSIRRVKFFFLEKVQATDVTQFQGYSKLKGKALV